MSLGIYSASPKFSHDFYPLNGCLVKTTVYLVNSVMPFDIACARVQRYFVLLFKAASLSNRIELCLLLTDVYFGGCFELVLPERHDQNVVSV